MKKNQSQTKPQSQTHASTNGADGAGTQLSIKEIFREMCPECKEILLAMAAKTVAVDSVKQQLREEWEKAD